MHSPARTSRYFANESTTAPYTPANHTGTVNRRLIGLETVGARQVEVVLGQLEPGRGALPHAHPGIEQVCYLLAGQARAEVNGEVMHLEPGDCCFFPAGAPHSFTVVGSEAARVLVIYAPPYNESPARSTVLR